MISYFFCWATIVIPWLFCCNWGTPLQENERDPPQKKKKKRRKKSQSSNCTCSWLLLLDLIQMFQQRMPLLHCSFHSCGSWNSGWRLHVLGSASCFVQVVHCGLVNVNSWSLLWVFFCIPTLCWSAWLIWSAKSTIHRTAVANPHNFSLSPLQHWRWGTTAVSVQKFEHQYCKGTCPWETAHVRRSGQGVDNVRF